MNFNEKLQFLVKEVLRTEDIPFKLIEKDIISHIAYIPDAGSRICG